MRRESFLPLRPAAFRGLPDAPPTPAPTGEVPFRLFGISRIEDWLGGGLRGDGLHEFHAAGAEDLASTLSVALLLGARPVTGARPGLIWLRRASKALPYGPGLADLGLDPGAITLLSLADDRAVLRAALDAVRAGATGAVLLELAGRQPLLDLTATRRLVLAAGETGTLVLLVRSDAGQSSSAAHSRWRVASAPSCPLEAGAPGLPAFALDLLRYRGGREGLHIILEWNRDTASFREREDVAAAAPLSGRASAVAAGGERPDPQSRAA
jgi:protein ImuA